ncbi:MAG TPA: hypothetical protein VN704_13440 [Verrucomicrobiae bacterium]|nr:hypothetical protein [Verrucomicrobiae bacterium]
MLSKKAEQTLGHSAAGIWIYYSNPQMNHSSFTNIIKHVRIDKYK